MLCALVSACSPELRSRIPAASVALNSTTQIITLSGPSTVSVGACSTFMVTSEADGIPTPVLSNTAVSLWGVGSGSFFRDPGCSSSTATITIPSGSSTQPVYFMASAPQNLNLQGSAPPISVPSISLIVVDTPTHLSFSTEPSATESSGNALSTQPVVQVLDSGNTVVAAASNSITLAAFTDSACTVATSGTFGVTTNPLTASSGSAAFAGVIYTGAPISIYLKASSSGLTSACSSAIAIGAGSVSKLAFSTEPSATESSGAALTTQPVVQVEDSLGTLVGTANNSITLAAFTDSGCTVTATGTFSVTTNPLAAIAGSATFAGVTYTGAPVTIYLKASSTSLTSACSTAIVVGAGSPSQLVFSTEPSATENSGITLATQPVIQIKDSAGTLVSTATNAITLAAYTDSGCTVAAGVTFAATTNPLAATAGSASFAGVTYTGPSGNIYIKASSGALTTACSSAIANRSVVTGVNSVISITSYTGCAVVNGGAQCWGYNAYGELGNNSTTSSNVPVQVQGLTSGVQAVSAGGSAGSDSSCAIVNGGAWCWGYNVDGELGNNSTVNSHVPSQVHGLTSGVTAISVGDTFSCAIVNGGAWCWGKNDLGQLGNNSTTNSLVPVQVQGLNSGVTAISAGTRFACAIVNGAAKCWGVADFGELGNNSTSESNVPVQVQGLTSGVQAISAGAYNTCAIVNGGDVCWGDDQAGELGDNGASGIYSSVPVQVQGLTSGVEAVSAADGLGCAIVNGCAMCWGNGSNGQLGNNTQNTDQAVPIQVQGLTSGVQAIAAGNNDVCALVNGSIQCWGYNSIYGVLGANSVATRSLIPVQVYGLNNGIQMQNASGGGANGCVVENGAAECWGDNSFGQIGDGTTTTRLIPTQVSGLTSGVEMISGAQLFTCAIVNGGAWCWGRNQAGNLGNNTTTDSHVPVQVQGLTSGVQSISVNGDTACAIVNGGAWCWGDGSPGALGNGVYANSSVPVQVTGMSSNVQLLSVGWGLACAVVNGGEQCWGENNVDQLGNGNSGNTNVPTQVVGLTSGVESISEGFGLACAVQNGSALCWGYGFDGAEVGTGTPGDYPTPAQVFGLTSGVQSISTGWGATCALVNGGAQCWGQNNDLLGNGLTATSDVPVQVTGLTSGVQSVTEGDSEGCALANGIIQCWGTGDLGNNSATASGVPVNVLNLP